MWQKRDDQAAGLTARTRFRRPFVGRSFHPGSVSKRIATRSIAIGLPVLQGSAAIGIVSMSDVFSKTLHSDCGKTNPFPNRKFGRSSTTRLRGEVGLDNSIGDKRTSDLSGGMKKRVGLARALAMSPELMFYDEPTTGLDPVMSGVINELIVQTQQRRQVTSVVVTHDMTTVRRVADHVIMLYPLARLSADEPQIVFEGSREELFACADPRVAQFVRGEPPQAVSLGRPLYGREERFINDRDQVPRSAGSRMLE